MGGHRNVIFCPECHDTVTIVDTHMRGIVHSCFCGRLSSWQDMTGPVWKLVPDPLSRDHQIVLRDDRLYKSASDAAFTFALVNGSVVDRLVPVLPGEEDENVRHVTALIMAHGVLGS